MTKKTRLKNPWDWHGGWQESLSLSGLWLASQFKASNGQLHIWTSHPIIVSKSYSQVGPVQVGLLAQAWKTLLLSWIWFPCCCVPIYTTPSVQQSHTWPERILRSKSSKQAKLYTNLNCSSMRLQNEFFPNILSGGFLIKPTFCQSIFHVWFCILCLW